ncbi:MAG: ABC transporter permease [Candidatus Taylorbacteria bacterium]|nr:ABC transporter permease [Candidatus Taylorbacteria bacterium]
MIESSALNLKTRSNLWRAVRIGFFLAVRDIKKANKWATALIIAVMILTFLNLIVVSGILVGLIEGAINQNKERYSSDIIISTLPNKRYIDDSANIVKTIKSVPEVLNFTTRYTEKGVIQANYKNRTRLTDLVDSAGGLVAGIDPVIENEVTGLSKYIVEGEYLGPNDTDQIMIGADLLYKYSPIDSPGFQTLKNVEVGSKVRLLAGSSTREVTVKGILKSKVGEIDQRVYMIDTEFRSIIGRINFNVNEIAIKLKSGADVNAVVSEIKSLGVDKNAKIQTYEEAQPKFLSDIKVTFSILGDLIGSIGLAVACITIFIIIFVNAITRRRYIGILKGIGIDALAIEVSYIFQSVFYALCGMIVGSVVVFAFLQPYITVHPINFPFSDGILVATPLGTFTRALILFIATMVAGYIPARIVVKQNTLDAILGR